MQNSLLEGEITEAKFTKLKMEVREKTVKEEDSVIWYVLQSKKHLKKETHGLQKGNDHFIIWLVQASLFLLFDVWWHKKFKKCQENLRFILFIVNINLIKNHVCDKIITCILTQLDVPYEMEEILFVFLLKLFRCIPLLKFLFIIIIKCRVIFIRCFQALSRNCMMTVISREKGYFGILLFRVCIPGEWKGNQINWHYSIR